MIELSSTTAIMLYLCLTLGVLLLLWGNCHYHSRRKKIDLSDQRLIICEYCHFAYLEKVAKPVTQCPQCNSFNK